MKLFRAETARDGAYDELVSLLRNGGIIAFPTDTAYGLGADPFNENALDRIFEIKGRLETKPILLLVDSLRMAESVVGPALGRVAERFWPGPLTIIAHAVTPLPRRLSGGTNKVGLRWPDAFFATTLVNRFGKPVTATSANRSGLPAAITAREVCDQLGGEVDAVVDGGELPYRTGSTILDLTMDPPVVLREGPVTFDSLLEFFEGKVQREVA